MRPILLRYLLPLGFLSLLLSGCMTWYQRHAKFHENFRQGKLAEAEKLLEGKKKKPKKKNQLLYYLEAGTVNHLQGDYEQSNQHFEQAYRLSEDYHKKRLNQAAGLLTNPQMEVYTGEDHEKLYVNYYKALNFLRQGQYNKALVECKRMNIRLDELSDRYKAERRWQENAYIHTVMGLIYEAQNDWNNAFIAYRNAYQAYQNSYQKFFDLKPPNQLKRDLIRTAWKTGFAEDARRYQEKFGMEKPDLHENESALVFIWHNGLCPIKDEWSVNFSIVRGSGGMVTFVNKQYGMSFAFPLDDDQQGQSSSLSDLEFVRVAFPQYRERPPVFTEGSLSAAGRQVPLEMGENVNAVAHKVLKDRMLFEFGKSLLRVALKKAGEYQVRKENEAAGAALSLFNAITEKADTRNWQTLPYAFHYGKIYLPPGQQQVKLNISGKGQSRSETFTYDIPPKGGMLFQTYRTLDAGSPR